MDKRQDKLQWRRDKRVAFDVDGTLITFEDKPKYEVIALLLWFVERGYDVIVWSGGGLDYAENWTRKLGLEDKVRVLTKGGEAVDIAFDDEPVQLGAVNIEI